MENNKYYKNDLFYIPNISFLNKIFYKYLPHEIIKMIYNYLLHYKISLLKLTINKEIQLRVVKSMVTTKIVKLSRDLPDLQVPYSWLRYDKDNYEWKTKYVIPIQLLYNDIIF